MGERVREREKGRERVGEREKIHNFGLHKVCKPHHTINIIS